MEHKFCQSCGMPLTTDNKGTNADGSRNEDYCIYCYKDGRFTQDFTMEQMIEHCAQFTDEINKESGQTLTQEQAKDMMRQFFPQLKRWKNRTAMFIAILTYKNRLKKSTVSFRHIVTILPSTMRLAISSHPVRRLPALAV